MRATVEEGEEARTATLQALEVQTEGTEAIHPSQVRGGGAAESTSQTFTLSTSLSHLGQEALGWVSMEVEEAASSFLQLWAQETERVRATEREVAALLRKEWPSWRSFSDTTTKEHINDIIIRIYLCYVFLKIELQQIYHILLTGRQT